MSGMLPGAASEKRTLHMNLRYSLRALALLAAATCAAFAPATRADVAHRIVADGETVNWPHAYTYYRFVVKDRAAENLSIAELALYDADGQRINLGLVQASEPEWSSTNLLSGTYSKYGALTTDTMSTTAVRMFDGNLATDVQGWMQNNNGSYYWIYFTMRLPAESDVPVASYNLAFTSQLDRAPKSWALQASDDHTNWVTLDEKDATAVAAIAPSAAGWCNGGTPIAVSDESAHFFVERGGTLAVTNNATPASVHSDGGSVSVAAGATFGLDVPSGESKRYIGGGLSGDGTFEKTGMGTLAVSGVNDAFAGTVKASGGSLAFRPLHTTPKFTYYRLVLTSMVGMVDNNLELAELALYDIAGERINMGLVRASEPEWSNTNLLCGTYSKFGYSTSEGMSSSAAYLFDGKPGTFMTGWATRTSDKTYWIYLNMRLPENADVAPAFYNIAFGRTDRAPRSWMLQGSDDHTTWFTLDKRDATAVDEIKPSSNNSWCNDGTPLPLVWEDDNAPVGEVDAKFFRFTVKAVGGSEGTRRISEIALYDMQGKRLNVGLTSAGRNISANELTAGSFTWKYQWNGTYSSDNTHEDKMFDENMETRLEGWSFGNAPDPEISARWLVWTMRLPDNAAPVASYNFAPYDPSVPSSYPANWLVEASRDGTAWFQVDARSGEAATSLFPAERGYCNNGHPIGFTSGFDRWLCPTGAVVAVANGATLELPSSGANSIAGLAIDLTAAGNAGTIANFTPASTGTLYLTSARRKPQLDDAAMPVTFTGLSNAENVEGWSVIVNGVPTDEGEYSLRFDANSVLRVTRKLGPMVLYVR